MKKKTKGSSRVSFSLEMSADVDTILLTLLFFRLHQAKRQKLLQRKVEEEAFKKEQHAKEERTVIKKK
jgi:hypothetical protein